MSPMLRTAHRQAHCIDCGYCLVGLSKRCPECGRRFDPDVLSSYAPPPATQKRPGAFVAPLLWMGYTMAVVVIATMLAVGVLAIFF